MSEKVRDEAAAQPPAMPEPPAARSAEPAGERPDGRPGERPGELPTRLEAFVSGGAYGVLAVGGAVLGLLGSFYHAVEAGPLPVLAIAFALLNFAMLRLAGWAMGTRLGAVIPGLGWLLVVIFLSSKRPEGDLVISASAAGYVFLLGGAIAAVIAIARTRSAHSLLPTDRYPL